MACLKQSATGEGTRANIPALAPSGEREITRSHAVPPE